MRSPRYQFTIRKLMIVVMGSALVFTPFAWTPPDSRGTLLIAVLTLGSLSLIVVLVRQYEERSAGSRRD